VKSVLDIEAENPETAVSGFLKEQQGRYLSPKSALGGELE